MDVDDEVPARDCEHLEHSTGRAAERGMLDEPQTQVHALRRSSCACAGFNRGSHSVV